ncbi:MAG: sulfite exporter TauE/SafE family protein [Desulfobacter sp.]|nr:MAG: sulfite exporter TauE/SafE family protein [Desulfobacter sp.]
MAGAPVYFIFFVGIILIAAYVRGYSGFGFSMITVAGLSLIYPPATVVPAVLMLEVAASGYLIPGVWKKINWHTLGWLSIGVTAGSPAGVWLLKFLPESLLKIGIAIVVAGLAGLLWTGGEYRRQIGRIGAIGAGWVSGVLTGSAAVGGPPVILFFFSSPTHTEVSRATLIAFFFGSDLIAAAVCGASGLITPPTVKIFLTALVPLVIGIVAGNRGFLKTDPVRFRKRVLIYLILLSGLLLAKSMWEICQPWST